MRALIVLSLTLVLGAVAAAPAQAAPRLCEQRAGRTLAATNVGRVFRDTSGKGEAVLRGCRNGSRTTLRLAVDGDCMNGGDVGPIAATGRYVAVTRISCDLVSGSSTIVLFDLRTMRDIIGATAFTGGSVNLDESSVTVSELALSRTGALAWVGQLSGSGVRRAELHLRRPFNATPELIAARSAFDLTDIAVTAHKLYWLEAGAAHSADL